MWNGELEIYVTMWWADDNHVSEKTTWRCQKHNRDIMVTFETHLKMLYSCEMTTKCNISWDCKSTLFGNILTGFWMYFMWWRWILLDWICNFAIMGIPSVIQLPHPCDVVMGEPTAPNATRTTNQKNWITSTKQNIQSSFDDRLKVQKLWGNNFFLFFFRPDTKI